jgi:hypothetical protein
MSSIHQHDPDPPSPSEPVDAAAAAAAAMDAALSDQPLPDLPEPAPPASQDPSLEKPKDDKAAAPDPAAGMDKALADDPAAPDKPAETPEAKAAREKAEAEVAAKLEPELDKDGKPVLDADGKPKMKAKADAAAAPAKDEAVEKEIGDLKLKDRAADRFRELSAVKAEYEPIKAVLHDVGVKSVEQVKGLVDQAKDAHYIVQQVEATGAQPEQYSAALNYLAATSAMQRGDLKAAEQVYDMLTGELAVVANLLGREVPGIVDPLKAYPDLQADVADEKISRERALELAKTRNTEALRNGNADAAAKAEAQRTSAEKAQVEAVEAGRKALDDLPAKLAATDPGGVEALKAKYPAFVEKVKEIVKAHPPGEWEQRAMLAYVALSAPAPAAAAAKAPAATNFKGTGTALASSGPTPFLTPNVTDPAQALELGLESVARGD